MLSTGSFRLSVKIPTDGLNEGLHRVRMAAYLHGLEVLFDFQEGPELVFAIYRNYATSPFWTQRRPGLLAPIVDGKEAHGIKSCQILARKSGKGMTRYLEIDLSDVSHDHRATLTAFLTLFETSQPTLEQIWAAMDFVWDSLGCDNRRPDLTRNSRNSTVILFGC